MKDKENFEFPLKSRMLSADSSAADKAPVEKRPRLSAESTFRMEEKLTVLSRATIETPKSELPAPRMSQANSTYDTIDHFDDWRRPLINALCETATSACGKRRVDVLLNLFFGTRELAELVDFVNDFVDENPWQVVDRLTEFVSSVDNQNGWTIAYGNFAAYSVQAGDVVFIARCMCTRAGLRWLCVVRGTWRCGKVAPSHPGSAQLQLKAAKKAGPLEAPRALGMLERILQRRVISSAIKVCEDVRKFLHRQAECERTSRWLVLAGRNFSVDADHKHENSAVTFFGVVNGLYLLVVKTAWVIRPIKPAWELKSSFVDNLIILAVIFILEKILLYRSISNIDDCSIYEWTECRGKYWLGDVLAPTKKPRRLTNRFTDFRKWDRTIRPSKGL